jgi:hypothetical protein
MATPDVERAPDVDLQFWWDHNGKEVRDITDVSDNYTPIWATHEISEGTRFQFAVRITGDYVSCGLGVKGQLDEREWVGSRKQHCFFVTTNESINEQVGEENCCQSVQPKEEDGGARSWVVLFDFDNAAGTLVVQNPAEEVIAQFHDIPDKNVFPIVGINNKKHRVELLYARQVILTKSARKQG